ncbi:MAG: urate hydroxylase PuuD [Deltaproteobacteria bacterium]|nr:urate hydroxylase PuuD [Deltaproteobacteria bacterium]
METYLFTLRWIHFLAGVTWIGLLYYFNLVQTPFFAKAEAPVKNGMIQKLVPDALGWFRWGAMFTFLSGILMYMAKLHQLGGGSGFFNTSYGWAITTGGLLGTLMFLNVWLVIWPKQKIVIASTTQVAQGGQALPTAAAAGRRAALSSRTNFVFSIPMLFFMGAASHFTLFYDASEGCKWGIAFFLAVVIGALELNSLIGSQGPTKKPLDSVKGAITAGFALTAVLFILFKLLF